jgi:hypothetical protein
MVMDFFKAVYVFLVNISVTDRVRVFKWPESLIEEV